MDLRELLTSPPLRCCGFLLFSSLDALALSGNCKIQRGRHGDMKLLSSLLYRFRETFVQTVLVGPKSRSLVEHVLVSELGIIFSIFETRRPRFPTWTLDDPKTWQHQAVYHNPSLICQYAALAQVHMTSRDTLENPQIQVADHFILTANARSFHIGM